jgi:hypothetical protein
MTRFLLVALLIQFPASLPAQTLSLKYRAAPPDNPLKGFVPYVGQGDPFPHSMEFWYFPMNRLMTGPTTFDWSPIEKKLDEISSRGCQAVIRVFAEYPGRPSSVPEFLIDQGVNVTSYEHDGQQNHTPDYNDPKMVQAMRSFIAAYGKKYDGDPRIGFITMGILGHWGEWHTYPRGELFASKRVQAGVMDAFESSFTRTKVLMRYPAGPDTWEKAPNHLRPFGYHDDSFAWATLDTGREEDNWFFQPAMRSAGSEAVEKWKTQPIGGEIRPEVWGCVFDRPGCAPEGQEFEKCVTETHATWLMDSGMFSLAKTKPTAERKREAIRQVQRMGYELFVSQAVIRRTGEQLSVHLNVTNNGVAPFYYDWPIELIVAEQQDDPVAKTPVEWKLTGIFPGDEVSWDAAIKIPDTVSKPKIAIRVVHPMPGGKPLRFANETQQADGMLWIE